MVATIDTTSRAGARKAAVLIVSLGGELAAPLMRSLTDDQIEAITREIVAMDRVGDDERANVLELCCARLAERTPAGQRAGSGFARDVLARSLGTKRAQDVLARVGEPDREQVFDFVRRTEISQIVAYFESEHPQTIALALAHMPAELSGQILAGLSDDLQADVAVRVARLGRTDPVVVREVDAAMRRKLQFCTTEGHRSAGGMEYLVDVLAACDSRSEAAILEAIAEADPDLAIELRHRMFTFQDLAILDDRSMQRLLREVDTRDLATAMRGAGEELQLAIFRNLSNRIGQTLREDIVRLGPIRLRQVEEAQQKIIALARRLNEVEEIAIPRGRQDVFI